MVIVLVLPLVPLLLNMSPAGVARQATNTPLDTTVTQIAPYDGRSIASISTKVTPWRDKTAGQKSEKTDLVPDLVPDLVIVPLGDKLD